MLQHQSLRHVLRRYVPFVFAALTALPLALAADDGNPIGGRVLAFDLGGALTDRAAAVAVQADGRIVVAGTVATGGSSWAPALARFLPDGSLDASFGNGGKVVSPFGVIAFNDSIAALHLLADGRILVAGTADWGAGDQDFWVGRLLPTGAPDTTFGQIAAVGATLVLFDLGHDLTDTLGAMTVDRSGRILLAGTVDVSSTNTDFGVARLSANGVLDTEFSADGKATVGFVSGGIDLGLAVEVDTAGRAVVAGAAWANDSGGHFNVGVARLLADGTSDSGFGSAGTSEVGMAGGGTNNEFAWALGVWPDGEIVVAGDAASGADEWITQLGRFSPSGAYLGGVLGPFCSFGSPPCPTQPQDSVRALRLQGDGKILLGGFARGLAANSDFGVGRFHRDLAPDFAFGTAGRVILDFAQGGGDNDFGAGLALDHDGRIVVAGSAEKNGLDTSFAWARFQSSYVFADGFDWPGGSSRWSVVTP
jgi:uncharacterized delta-60 repeat protein